MSPTDKPKLTPLSKRGLARVVRADDGKPMMVIRPATPALVDLALTLAKIAADKNDGALFQRLPSEVGDYTVQGWLGEKANILDRDGYVIGKCEPGDSFVTPREDRPS